LASRRTTLGIEGDCAEGGPAGASSIYADHIIANAGVRYGRGGDDPDSNRPEYPPAHPVESHRQRGLQRCGFGSMPG